MLYLFLRILSGRKQKDMTQRANFGGVLKEPLDRLYD
jgi:hypothetical protein